MQKCKTIKNKHKNQHNKHQQLRIDATFVSAGYTRPHSHGLGIWNNPRVPMTIRVDKKLKLAFSEASKAFSGSTCSAIEYVMAAYVGAFKNQVMSGVYPKLTVDIGEIVIQRNLRERRRVVVERKEIETVSETVVSAAKVDRSVDYAGLSEDKLRQVLARSRVLEDSVRVNMCLCELKRRGLK